MKSTLMHCAPVTPMAAVKEILHGVEIVDDYRWLEDANSHQVREWINAQSEYTRSFLDQIQSRDSIGRRVKEMLCLDVVDSVMAAGNRYFYRKREAVQDQACIYESQGPGGHERLLVNPSVYGTDGFTSIHILKASRDGRLLAFGIKRGGEHFQEVRFLDVDRIKLLDDHLPRGIFRGLAFSKEFTGFYYSHVSLEGHHPCRRAIYYHEFDTDCQMDREVFYAGEDPTIKLSLRASPCETYLLYAVRASKPHRTKKTYFHEPDTHYPPKLLAEFEDKIFSPIFAGKRLLALTDLDAPNLRVVEVNPDQPEPPMWRQIVPQSRQRIQQVSASRTRLFVTYAGVFTQSAIFDLDGNHLGKLPHPETGTVRLLSCAPSRSELFFSFTSFDQPTQILRFDCVEAKSDMWAQKKVPFLRPSTNVSQVTFVSKDGARIPMFLVRDGRLPRTEPIPTVLTAYGGFATSSTPQFTAFGTFLIEQGCLFSVANVRGGAEFGGAWHEEGKLHKHQNAIDDFISAAEYLIKEGKTSPDRLGVVGASNGALLVAAAIVQRPDLFRAAICLGPLTDMLRYHLLGSGQFWTQEFGSAEDVHDFPYLYGYSPYHRVRNGTSYPAVMFISGGADYVCDGMHARKMTARLQNATTSGFPILLDYKDERGHSPVLPLTERIRGLTDRLAFFCDQLGVSVGEV